MDKRFISEVSDLGDVNIILRMSDQAFLCPILESTFAEFLLCAARGATPSSFILFRTTCARFTKTFIHILIYIL